MSDDPNPFEESVPLQGNPEPPPVPEEPAAPKSMTPPPKSASTGFSGMDWLGDDATTQPVTGRITESGRRPGSGPRPRPRPDRNVIATVLIVATTLAVVIIAVVAGVLWANPGGGAHRAGSPAASPAAPTGAVATPDCLDGDHDGVVTGTAAGGPDSSLDAIFWFQHSYYVERSGSRARAVVAPDATVTSADEIQRGIDSVPSGTRYCVRITPISATNFHVELTEARPATEPKTYIEIITTAAQTDGRTMITGIAGG